RGKALVNAGLALVKAAVSEAAAKTVSGPLTAVVDGRDAVVLWCDEQPANATHMATTAKRSDRGGLIAAVRRRRSSTSPMPPPSLRAPVRARRLLPGSSARRSGRDRP